MFFVDGMFWKHPLVCGDNAAIRCIYQMNILADQMSIDLETTTINDRWVGSRTPLIMLTVHLENVKKVTLQQFGQGYGGYKSSKRGFSFWVNDRSGKKFLHPNCACLSFYIRIFKARILYYFPVQHGSSSLTSTASRIHFYASSTRDSIAIISK